jgi:SRSO17 transposase
METQAREQNMPLPIVAPAPLVNKHAEAFQDVFANRKQFRHFKNYLTGLVTLANKSMANIVRCVLDSADKTNLARFFSEAPWREAKVNARRIEYMLEQTKTHRQPAEASYLVIDDTLCKHVGSLFEYVDKHYDHNDGSYPLAHNLVTSHFVSGAVRFPLDLRQYRRYEEFTRWESFVKKHFPAREIPKKRKARAKFRREVAEELLKDPEFAALHAAFQTKIVLAKQLINQAVARKVPFSVVLFDSWYLSKILVELLIELKKDWVSLLKKNRNLDTNSFVLKDADGNPIALEGPRIQVQDLVPHIPASAYKPVTVKDKTYWCFTRSVRLSSLGKVRIVICFENAELTGTYVVLITNRLDWSAKKIIATYLQRWPIETFYQDSKGNLGLDEYRMRSAEAIEKHWCLVFVAYSFLHLDCLPSSPEKVTHPIKTIGEACRQQAQSLIEALILYAHDQLTHGCLAADVFAALFAKQRVMVS